MAHFTPAFVLVIIIGYRLRNSLNPKNIVLHEIALAKKRNKNGSFGHIYKLAVLFCSKPSNLFFQVKTNELVGPGIHVHFKLSHDGSGKGAALVTSSVEGSRRQSVIEVAP